jgi:hypothetical protein
MYTHWNPLCKHAKGWKRPCKYCGAFCYESIKIIYL